MAPVKWAMRGKIRSKKGSQGRITVDMAKISYFLF